MATRRPQLSSDDLLRLKWLLGSVLALLSAWTIFFMEIESLLLVAAVTTAAVAAIARPAWPAHVPPSMHRLAFPAMLAAFVLDLYTSREPLPALIRLDLLLILYRVTTHRRRRDDLQLIVLGLFLIVVAGVLTVSLAFAIQILAFTACALLFLFVITLADVDGADSSDSVAAPGAVPNWTRGRWRDVFGRVSAATDWRLAALAVLLFGGVVVVSGLLFLAIPRFEIQNSLFLDRLISRKTHTGFSDSIRFGEVTAITQDNSLALNVDVDDWEALPALPYWRMVVLDKYTGGGFTQSAALRRRLDAARTRPGDTGIAPPGTANWTLYLQPGISRYLPLLGAYQRLRFTEPQTFAVHDALRVVALRRDPPKMLAYQVQGMETDATIPDRDFAQLRKAGAPEQGFLDMPVPDPDRARLEVWAASLDSGNDGRSVAAFADRATQWLERHHAYALENRLPAGSGDPVVRWLDSETPGHCEYFAGSMMLLARAAGYPARLVVGFKGGTWNPYSESLAVRSANAHAWCELFDDQREAWIRVDPTPGGEAAARLAEEAGAAAREARLIDTGWQARVEALRVFWYRRIVNFDQSSQRELANHAKRAIQQWGDRLRRWLNARAAGLLEWLDRPWGLDRATRLAAGASLLAMLIWTWRRFGRGRWLRWRSAHARAGADPVRREAGRWLRRAALRTRRGRASLPNELREALIRLRYGATGTWPDPATVFRAARRACRR